jgi:energy-coupling factor transport system substrate-specific component
VSWQLGAFAILFGALAGGFAWYERTRPDARIVALVATLAAFAALGRIAFAALPNVKPTTDIVLISGYALGPAPGFVVGAVAGLTSNFFFGQGPWTPWQMAAWGATGLIGAGLAVVTRRRVARWPLALVCMVVGFAFTAAQDAGDWVNYSDHSLRQLGVYVGRGVGFDAIHAAGCLIFALAFGPALARAIGRFAERLQVTWRAPRSVIVPTAIALVLAGWLAGQPGLGGPGWSAGSGAGSGSGSGAGSGVATAQAATTPAGYLRSAQNRDGGFGGSPGQPSSQLYSGWVALGLAAEGSNPRRLTNGGASVIDYLRSGAGSDTDPGAIERTILAAGAAGVSSASFGGRDLLAALEGEIHADGSVSGQTNLTAFAVLALRAAGVAPPTKTLTWLVRQQDRDGGFNFATAGGASDVDDTGAVLEALAGVPSSAAARARSRAIGFIRSQQDSDGGFPSAPGAGSNAQSTAWAIQGLIAGGADPGSLHHGGPSPLQYLDGLIAPDGHVRYSRSSDQTPVWVTAEALMALAGKPLPLAPVALPVATAQHKSDGRHSATHRADRKHSRRHPVGHTVAAERLTVAFATYAGVAAAVAFAPIGLG